MDELLEALAELEHEQWMAWAKSLISEVAPDRRVRWSSYMRAYKDLPPAVKEKDRELARQVLKTIEAAGFKVVKDD